MRYAQTKTLFMTTDNKRYEIEKVGDWLMVRMFEIGSLEAEEGITTQNIFEAKSQIRKWMKEEAEFGKKLRDVYIDIALHGAKK